MQKLSLPQTRTVSKIKAKIELDPSIASNIGSSEIDIVVETGDPNGFILGSSSE